MCYVIAYADVEQNKEDYVCYFHDKEMAHFIADEYNEREADRFFKVVCMSLREARSENIPYCEHVLYEEGFDVQ